MRLLSHQEVINIIKDVHGDTYDLSKVQYLNRRTKIELICKRHGSFMTQLDQIKRGQGCPVCGRSGAGKKRRVTYEDFLKMAHKAHGDKYKYDPHSYQKISSKVKIKCSNHGWFEQGADGHVRQSQGCPECGRLSQISKRVMTLSEFIERSNMVHENKYDYSKSKYENNRTKIEVICPKHGAFFPSPDNHLNGSGCPQCGIEEVHLLQIKGIEDFIKDSRKVHGDKYDYSKSVYEGGKKPLIIICPKHGEFHQTPNLHQRGNGCPNCNASKGENKIKIILQNLEIRFEQQKTFVGLSDVRKLKCDFYLPDYNSVIEFNGRQHYEPVKTWGGEPGLKEVQRRDQIKRNYFKSEGIKLLEIHYLENEIEKTILSFLGINPSPQSDPKPGLQVQG